MVRWAGGKSQDGLSEGREMNDRIRYVIIPEPPPELVAEVREDPYRAVEEMMVMKADLKAANERLHRKRSLKERLICLFTGRCVASVQ